MTDLTKRECESLALLAQGNTTRKIAELLNISTPTVAMHLLHARQRLGARTREHAVALGVATGKIDITRPIVKDTGQRCSDAAPLSPRG